MDMRFLESFIPGEQMELVLDSPKAFKIILEIVEEQLRSLPTPGGVYGKDPEDIKVWAHYSNISKDWWLYALEPDCPFARALVCLCGEGWDAKRETIYIPGLISRKNVSLDLHWYPVSLKQVMDKVEAEAE